MSLKVFHIGVFDRNIGDNIALIHAQESILNVVPDAEFSIFNIEHFWSNENNIEWTKEYLSKIGKQFDLILVGGGGLVEYGGYENLQTKYKLPFNKEILDSLDIPIVFHSVGINMFRGALEYSAAAKKSLLETIQESNFFSLRNDKSLEKLRDWIGIKNTVRVTPDPGLLHLSKFKIEDKGTVTRGGIQPAFNHSEGINRRRFLNEQNRIFLKEFFKDYLSFPHTIRDFGRLGREDVISKEQFQSKYRFAEHIYDYLDYYRKIDYVVALRGHGQMITIGMNIPGIYLSTQDKVIDFSTENGFTDYTVDIQDENWQEHLAEKVRKLTEPNSEYLAKWYSIRHEAIKKWHSQDMETVTHYLEKLSIV